MRKNNRTARKNKGQIALYFPKWYLSPDNKQNAHSDTPAFRMEVNYHE